MSYTRLTRRNADGTTWVKCAVCDIQDKCDFTKETCCQELQDLLAELEDKIEQGTLIELGYHIRKSYRNHNDQRYKIVVVEENEIDKIGYDGLTREEAEKRILELQGETKL